MQTFMTPILPRTPELARTAEAAVCPSRTRSLHAPPPALGDPARPGVPGHRHESAGAAPPSPRPHLLFFHYLADGPWNRYGDPVDLMPVPRVTTSSMRDHQQQQRPTGSPPVGRLRRTLRMARPARSAWQMTGPGPTLETQHKVRLPPSDAPGP